MYDESDDKDEMTSEELSAQFGEEFKEEEPEEQSEEGVARIAARVKNMATLAVSANLTPAGTSLCNTYVHVLKSLYVFSDTLNDKDKEKMKTLIRSHERMPADFISSVPKPEKPKPVVRPEIAPTINPVREPPIVCGSDEEELDRAKEFLKMEPIPRAWTVFRNWLLR